MATLDNAIWLTGPGGTAQSGSTVLSEGGNSTTVTGTFTANAWDASQSGYNISEFGAFGVTSPITANYQFSNPVENLTFDLEHVNGSGTTYDDNWTIYAYDEDGNLIPAADVIAGISGLVDENVITNPDGSVTIDSNGTTANDVTFALPGKVSELNFIFQNGPQGTQSGGSGLSDFDFTIPVEPDGTVEGTAGADTIDASYTGDPEGDDVDNNDAILPGDTGDDDLIEAYGGNDSVSAGAGHDEVYGGGGGDTMFGGTGNDTVYGGSGNDTIGDWATEDGNDTFYGGGGADFLNGGSGDDRLFGGAGDDTLTGAVGDDTLSGGLGSDDFWVTDDHESDTIFGGEDADGSDTDTIAFANYASTQGVSVTGTGDEQGSYDFDGTSGTGSFEQIEELSGTDYDDTLNMSADSSGMTLRGNDGDDTITGGTGDDSITGGADRDTFVVQDDFGNDTIVGGQSGDNYDTIDLSGMSNPVSVSFSGPGAGTITDLVTGDVIVFSEIEQLILTDQADVVDATNDNGYTYIQTLDGNDSVQGSAGDDIYDDENGAPDGQGNDTFFGNDGNDQIWAGTDDDTIYGGSGDDTLQGQAGNDTIQGGTGADTLGGGAGDDTLIFAEGDTVYGGDGDDTFVLEDLGETGTGGITIDGGSETGQDTLQLGSLADLSSLNATDDGTGSYSGTVTLDDGTILTFSEIENIICFTPGTRIATPRGAIAIETLAVGDTVVTRDHGLQTIRWIEARTVPAVGRFAPVRIRPNALVGLERDLVVSPQHRLLFQGYRAELLFGESEVLVSAAHLVDGMDVTREEGENVTYIHMLFDQHEIIFADGAATESFHPGSFGLDAVGGAAREELFAIFPDLRTDFGSYGDTARRCLKRHEAQLIRT